MNRLIIFKNLCILMILLCGCAVVDSNVSPEYPRALLRDKVTAGKGSIQVAQFIRNTPEDFEGLKKSIYGFATTRLHTTTPPETLLRKALTTELEGLNYSIIDSQADIEVYGKLHQYFVEPQINLISGNFYAVMELEIFVIKNEQEAYKRNFQSIGAVYTPLWNTTLPVALDDIYQTTLESATRKLIAQVVPAVHKIISTPKQQVN